MNKTQKQTNKHTKLNEQMRMELCDERIRTGTNIHLDVDLIHIEQIKTKSYLILHTTI